MYQVTVFLEMLCKNSFNETFILGQVDSLKDEELMPDEGVAVDGETMKAGESLSGENVSFLVSFLASLPLTPSKMVI